jgi:hypothetical protein
MCVHLVTCAGQAAQAVADPAVQPQPAAVHAPAGAYTQREEHLQRQEAAGDIEFAYVLNDGQPHNMMRWVCCRLQLWLYARLVWGLQRCA